jgi:hypothetical protein
MHNEDAGFTGPDPDVNIVEVDEDSTPGFANKKRSEAGIYQWMIKAALESMPRTW